MFASPETIVAFESPRRRRGVAGGRWRRVDPERPVAVCRELTKLHEEVVRGTAAELAARYASAEPRGEIVLVVGGAPAAAPTEPSPAVDALRRLVEAGARARGRPRRSSRELTGVPANALYRAVKTRRLTAASRCRGAAPAAGTCQTAGAARVGVASSARRRVRRSGADVRRIVLGVDRCSLAARRSRCSPCPPAADGRAMAARRCAASRARTAVRRSTRRDAVRRGRGTAGSTSRAAAGQRRPRARAPGGCAFAGARARRDGRVVTRAVRRARRDLPRARAGVARRAAAATSRRGARVGAARPAASVHLGARRARGPARLRRPARAARRARRGPARSVPRRGPRARAPREVPPPPAPARSSRPRVASATPRPDRRSWRGAGLVLLAARGCRVGALVGAGAASADRRVATRSRLDGGGDADRPSARGRPAGARAPPRGAPCPGASRRRADRRSRRSGRAAVGGDGHRSCAPGSRADGRSRRWCAHRHCWRIRAAVSRRSVRDRATASAAR